MAHDHGKALATKQTDKIWIDGELLPWSESRVHVLTHTLHYGLGAFEGIRCYKRATGRAAVFRLDDHLQRLLESCAVCMIDAPYTKEQMKQACLDTLRANHVEEAYLRPLVFLGDPQMGLGSLDNPVRLAVACFGWGAYLGEEGLRRGIRAKVSSFTRPHVNSGMSKGKICGQYVNSILAKREVMRAGYDEAILLDHNGLVTEASGENFFMVSGGKLVTPPLSSAILAGITRDSIIRLARDLGLEVAEATFTRDQVYSAEEVFLCGTAAEVTPVREVDDRRIGNGEVGPITKRVQESFFKVVKGPETRYPEWLTFV